MRVCVCTCESECHRSLFRVATMELCVFAFAVAYSVPVVVVVVGAYSSRALYVVFQTSASVTALWNRWKMHSGRVTRWINDQAIKP